MITFHNFLVIIIVSAIFQDLWFVYIGEEPYIEPVKIEVTGNSIKIIILAYWLYVKSNVLQLDDQITLKLINIIKLSLYKDGNEQQAIYIYNELSQVALDLSFYKSELVFFTKISNGVILAEHIDQFIKIIDYLVMFG